MKILYKSQEKVIELFDDFSRIISEAKYGIKQTRRRSQNINSQKNAQVTAGNTSESLLNEIRKLYIFCIEENEEVYLKSIQQYDEFNKVIKQNEYYIYEF